MANDLPDCGKALQIAEKVQMIDSEEISKIFKNIEDVEINDFIDQFIYYRNLRGYTLDEVGQAIGVSGKYYWKYENRVHKLTNIDRIQKIASIP